MDHSICSRLFPYVFLSIEGDRRFAAPPQQEIGCGAVSEMYMQFFVVDGTDRFGRAIVDV